jgi:tetratricopeptide (TPR) repeat protein
VRNFAAVVALATITCGVAYADRVSDARDHYKRGLAAYGLGQFSEAALEYEAAFKLEPDPALLYNAAQAHRLGGNAHRALELYQSYLRLFGDGSTNRSEVERHIADLKKAVEAEKVAASTPPTKPIILTPLEKPPEVTPELKSASRPALEPAAAQPAAQPLVPTKSKAPPSSVPLARAEETRSARPWWKRGWVWGAVAGIAVAGVAIGVGVALAPAKDPVPSMGSLKY